MTLSAAGTSSPSSPTLVATNTLISPSLNLSSWAICSFCFIPIWLPLLACPTNLPGIIPDSFSSIRIKLSTVSLYSVKIITLPSPLNPFFTNSTTNAGLGWCSSFVRYSRKKLETADKDRKRLVLRSVSLLALSRYMIAHFKPWVSSKSNNRCSLLRSPILLAASYPLASPLPIAALALF